MACETLPVEPRRRAGSSLVSSSSRRKRRKWKRTYGRRRPARAAEPAFVSVTYGAGGSTRERTHALVERHGARDDDESAAHLTCVGASRR